MARARDVVRRALPCINACSTVRVRSASSARRGHPLTRAGRASGTGAWDGMGRRWRRLARAVGGAVPTHCTALHRSAVTGQDSGGDPYGSTATSPPRPRWSRRQGWDAWPPPPLTTARRCTPSPSRWPDRDCSRSRACGGASPISQPPRDSWERQREGECVAGSLAATACHEPGRAARPIHSPEPILSRSPIHRHGRRRRTPARCCRPSVRSSAPVRYVPKPVCWIPVARTTCKVQTYGTCPSC
jgi:hypothetical protein